MLVLGRIISKSVCSTKASYNSLVLSTSKTTSKINAYSNVVCRVAFDRKHTLVCFLKCFNTQLFMLLTIKLFFLDALLCCVDHSTLLSFGNDTLQIFFAWIAPQITEEIRSFNCTVHNVFPQVSNSIDSLQNLCLILFGTVGVYTDLRPSVSCRSIEHPLWDDTLSMLLAISNSKALLSLICVKLLYTLYATMHIIVTC